MRSFRTHHLLLASVLALFTGCASWVADEDETKNWSARKLYSEAKSSLNTKDYEQAIAYYETLEARFPFGRFAQQAQLETAYAYYKFEEPDSAIAAADRFIKLNPRHPHVDYAYYLKGLSNFNRGKSLVNRIIKRPPSEIDPGPHEQAFKDFSTLVQRFPDSGYAPDARQRMIYLRNVLADYELNVADFYLRRGAYVAAANRCKYMIEHYQGAQSMPRALSMLAEAYTKLGMTDLAEDTQRVLQHNFPQQPTRRN